MLSDALMDSLARLKLKGILVPGVGHIARASERKTHLSVYSRRSLLSETHY